MLKEWIEHPLTRGLDLDDPRTTDLRRQIIKEKPFLRHIYADWYSQIAAALPEGGGAVLEIGSGPGFLGDFVSGLIASDMFCCPGVRIVLDGLHLPFAAGTLRGVAMTNVLHHLPDPRGFFSEALHCVRPGRAIVMIEPWVKPWSRLIYTRLVGSAIIRRLNKAGHRGLLVATREQLDLRDQAAVTYWFRANRPDFVFLVAGTVGGILANSTRPAEFIYDNMMIHATVVHAAHVFGVKKLLYLGSSCIYPRDCPQPMTEEALLTAPLEPTNEPYAVEKIAGIKLCQAYRRQYGCNFISAMPTNLYGPNDNFDLTSSHVLPALIRKFHNAKIEGTRDVAIWGTGTPKREFMHVDDLANACLFLMEHYDQESHINIGTGEGLTIAALAELVRDIVHPAALIAFDTSKPDGSPRKLLDASRLHRLGWTHKSDLRAGVQDTYRWFLEHKSQARLERAQAVSLGSTNG